MNHNNISNLCIFSLVVLVLCFTGCAKYNPKPLITPSIPQQQQNNLSVSAHALTESDCRYYFSRRILSKGYQPIQLSINNGTNQTYTLYAKNIDLALESRFHMTNQLKLSATSRVCGWGIGGLFIWPLLIPAVAEVSYCSKANRSLDQDFAQRIIDTNSRIFISPGQTINKILFVSHDNFRSDFNMTIVDEANSNNTVFNLNI